MVNSSSFLIQSNIVGSSQQNSTQVKKTRYTTNSDPTNALGPDLIQEIASFLSNPQDLLSFERCNKNCRLAITYVWKNLDKYYEGGALEWSDCKRNKTLCAENPIKWNAILTASVKIVVELIKKNHPLHFITPDQTLATSLNRRFSVLISNFPLFRCFMDHLSLKLIGDQSYSISSLTRQLNRLSEDQSGDNVLKTIINIQKFSLEKNPSIKKLEKNLKQSVSGSSYGLQLLIKNMIRDGREIKISSAHKKYSKLLFNLAMKKAKKGDFQPLIDALFLSSNDLVNQPGDASHMIYPHYWIQKKKEEKGDFWPLLLRMAKDYHDIKDDANADICLQKIFTESNKASLNRSKDAPYILLSLLIENTNRHLYKLNTSNEEELATILKKDTLITELISNICLIHFKSHSISINELNTLIININDSIDIKSELTKKTNNIEELTGNFILLRSTFFKLMTLFLSVYQESDDLEIKNSMASFITNTIIKLINNENKFTELNSFHHYQKKCDQLIHAMLMTYNNMEEDNLLNLKNVKESSKANHTRTILRLIEFIIEFRERSIPSLQNPKEILEEYEQINRLNEISTFKMYREVQKAVHHGNLYRHITFTHLLNQKIKIKQLILAHLLTHEPDNKKIVNILKELDQVQTEIIWNSKPVNPLSVFILANIKRHLAKLLPHAQQKIELLEATEKLYIEGIRLSANPVNERLKDLEDIQKELEGLRGILNKYK